MTIVPEMILGETMSNILYSLLIIIEVISILENFDDAGHKDITPFLRIFKKKKAELIGEEGHEK
jgi:hypothetical protein